jgi:hypothetical protein
MATVTLSQGIEVAITQTVPEINRVVDVTDHASGTNPYFEPFSFRATPTEGRQAEDHDEHQALRRSAQAGRTQPRQRRPPAVAGNRRPTGPDWPTTDCPEQRTRHRSARSSLRVSDVFARLGRLGC